MELIFGEHTLPDVILLNCMSFSNLSVTKCDKSYKTINLIKYILCMEENAANSCLQKTIHDKKKKLNIAHMSNIQQTKQL